jgi:uncharacterized protein (DUF433 family)
MAALLKEQDPLNGGSYTLQEAARLLGIANTSRIRGWIAGYQNRPDPIIRRQYMIGDGAQELGFWDLLEVRFIEHFRKQGVSLQSLRKAAEAARLELKRQHPFAISNIKFMTDRKRIFMQSAEETGDRKLLDLTCGQYAMYDVIERNLAKGIEFDPSTGLAERWHPQPTEFPHVVLNPRISFGQPCIEQFRMPTATLFQAWKTEENDYDAVSDWYEVGRPFVEEAVKFEMALTA